MDLFARLRGGRSGQTAAGDSATPEVRVSTARIQSSIPGAAVSELTTSQQRYGLWRKSQPFAPELLLPHIDRRIEREWPTFMARASGAAHRASEAIHAQVGELGPWFVPFRIDADSYTMDIETGLGREAAARILFRRELITGTVAALLGNELRDVTVLDIGCNCGFFSLDIADRGAKHVDGIDLRHENVAQARFLAEHYGVENVAFSVSDADAIQSDQQWDVVLNLGVLYHVVNPLQFIRQTYELCRKFAIIDTVCHTEPISAYLLFGNKDVDKPAEGRETWEFHPTYRGAIETIRYAGFSEVIELLGEADPPHPFYANGTRRCFLAIK